MNHGGEKALKRLLIIGLTVTALAVSVVGPVSAKAPADEAKRFDDNISTPLSDKQAALKSSAQAAVVSGEATAKGHNKVVKVAKGQIV
jgi:hypothetical protein